MMIGLLGASLEGAADGASSGEPCCQGDLSVHGIPLDDEAEPGESGAEEDCVVCTPLCHCGSHGGALFGDWPNGAFAPPGTAPAHIGVRYTSFIDPPFLPPPIR